MTLPHALIFLAAIATDTTYPPAPKAPPVNRLFTSGIQITL